MSELKAISGHEIREDIDYNTRGVDPEDKDWHKYGKELCDTLYYIKSEADKVIAEKDKEIQRLENLCESYRIDCDNLAIREANAYKEIERDNKQLRHQKYKWCLAMARWCETQFAYYIASCDRYDSKYVNKKAGHFYKWKYKWLELAEKFKEAK